MKQNRPIPEDTTWHYFLQILQALHHGHHSKDHSGSWSGSTVTCSPTDAEGGSQRVQILHHDLKPDNGTSSTVRTVASLIIYCPPVFLDENNRVKLGDFGLSKALAHASFGSTYVGVHHSQGPIPAYTHLFLKTPCYMSPELMQEKAYDSKSDIWSLACLIYELCALKPPFHEAKTHSELSIFILYGRFCISFYRSHCLFVG